jgi:hypothetical protein
MTEPLDSAPAVRDEHGRFVVGHTAGGRPRGLTQAEKVRVLLEPYRDELIGELMKNVRDPDRHVSNGALKMVFDYLAPKAKPESERVVIEGLAEAATLADKARVIAAAVGSGAISFEAGERVARMLDIVQRSHVIDELRNEVDKLKAAANGRTLVPNEHGDLV